MNQLRKFVRLVLLIIYRAWAEYGIFGGIGKMMHHVTKPCIFIGPVAIGIARYSRCERDVACFCQVILKQKLTKATT